MIKNITITNFQSHKKTKIDFSKGINVLVGKSNSGKSSIIRAINLVLFNRPLGNAFVSHGAKRCEINLEIEKQNKKITITRIKGDKNEYILNNDTEHPLTAFGNNPPKEVSDLVNLGNINFQYQFDPYFLIFKSPGDVATYIRSITKLDEIDKVIDVISSKMGGVQADIKTTKEAITNTEKQLEVLNQIDLAKLEMLVNKAQKLVDASNKLIERRTKLTGLIEQIQDLNIKTIYLPDNINQLIGSIAALRETYLNNVAKRNKLAKIIDDLCSVKVINLDEAAATAILERKKQAIDTYNSNAIKLNKLMGIVESLANIETDIGNIDKDIITTIEEKKQLMGQLTICPECGEALTERGKKQLLGGSI